MEQVAFVSLKNEWEDLDSLLTSSLTSAATYSFECHGSCECLIQFGTSKPTNMAGIKLDANGMKLLSYTIGTDDIYVRGIGGASTLNIVKTS